MIMDEIIKLREEIDEIDREIMELLDRRISTAETIGELKVERNMGLEDKRREDMILDRAGEYRPIFEKIILHTKAVESRCMDPTSKVSEVDPSQIF